MTLGALLDGVVAAEQRQDYETRYGLLVQAQAVAHCLGYGTGYRIDEKEPDWPVLFIELPTGQVSWHMPAFPVEWDGHTTEEKEARLRRFCQGIAGHEGQAYPEGRLAKGTL